MYTAVNSFGAFDTGCPEKKGKG